MPTGARTVTVVRKPKVDKLSPTPPGATVEFDITDVSILPRQSYEQGRGWVSVEGIDIWATDASLIRQGEVLRRLERDSVLASDQIRFDGDLYSVVEPPSPFEKGTRLAGLRISIRRVGVS